MLVEQASEDEVDQEEEDQEKTPMDMIVTNTAEEIPSGLFMARWVISGVYMSYDLARSNAIALLLLPYVARKDVDFFFFFLLILISTMVTIIIKRSSLHLLQHSIIALHLSSFTQELKYSSFNLIEINRTLWSITGI